MYVILNPFRTFLIEWYQYFLKVNKNFLLTKNSARKKASTIPARACTTNEQDTQGLRITESSCLRNM